jgi:hypothetical protein
VSLSRTDLTLSASTITVNSSTASFSATASTDATAEGYVTFQAILRTGSQSGPEVKRSDAIGLIDSSIPIPTYAIAPTASVINEGGSVTFNVATTNVNPGTTLYWTLSRSDLTPNSGSFVVSSGSNSFAVTANLDSTTEGYTTFTASLRTGSTSGGILITSSAVGINDTSIAIGTISGEVYRYDTGAGRFRGSTRTMIWTTQNVTKLELEGIFTLWGGGIERREVGLNNPTKKTYSSTRTFGYFDVLGNTSMKFYLTYPGGTKIVTVTNSLGAFSG